ncbi:MAG: tetratricopeptide repeat protein [Bryobacterales bacterium]|nr:tetratricopeptide repeat protein [Bryobacterales bacterium]
MTLRGWCCIAAGVVLAVASPALGQRGDERGARHEALASCDELHDRGNAIDAATCYRGLLRLDDLAAQAEAYWMLGDLKAANECFREAVKLEPEDPDLRVRWGHLYIQSHQQAEAGALFQEALELDEDHVSAQLGMATVLASRFEGKAVELAQEALKQRPEQAEGHLLLGRMALEEGDLAAARKSLETGLDQALELGLAPLGAYALLASLEMLEGERDNQWVDKALAYNPRHGEIYAEQAHFYVITRRYREATERLRKAIEVAPSLWRAHAELGVNLMREGLDDEGRRHLEIAYGGDPYSAKTVNTLRLLDTYDQFETFEDADPGADGVVRAVFRLDKDESELLLPYVRELTNRAVAEFTRKYDFELKSPVRVEFYPNHDDFAVRTMAMPGIGLLGVTFGYVVAMDSPSGREPGGFHWGTTLWHELAHVFTLESTDHLVPRWYSEGISMYEEWMADVRWGESVGPEYIEAVRKSELLPIVELDRGFIRPKHAGQVAISYMQAGFVCKYIAERWGEGKLVELLRGFGAKVPTDANIAAVLGTSPEDFDEQFDDYMRDALGPALDGLPRWRSNLKTALERARDGEWAEVIEPAEAAKAAYPQHVGSGSAYMLLANAHDKAGNREAAVGELQEYERRGGRQPETLKKLAGWLEEAERSAEAVYTYEGLIYNWPQDEELHARLGELHLEAGKTDLARREFEVVLALDPLDRATAEYNLARAYVKIGDLASARLHVLQALERAPTFGPALQLLLQVKR